jgi:hypothetical protein
MQPARWRPARSVSLVPVTCDGVLTAGTGRLKFQLAADEWHGSRVAGKLAVR